MSRTVKIAVKLDLLDEARKKYPETEDLDSTALAHFLIRKLLKSK